MYQWLNIAVSLYRCRCINLCFARMNFRSERDKWKCQCHPKAKGKVSPRCDRRREKLPRFLNAEPNFSFRFKRSRACLTRRRITCVLITGWQNGHSACDLHAADLVQQRARQGEIPVQLLARRDRLFQRSRYFISFFLVLSYILFLIYFLCWISLT